MKRALHACFHTDLFANFEVKVFSGCSGSLILTFLFFFSLTATTVVSQTADPKQVPVQGSGSGTTVDVTVKRSTERWGSGSYTPTWEVELHFSNYTQAISRLGNATTVLEINEPKQEVLGLYIFRDSTPEAPGGKKFELRYGLTWGVTVGADSATPWPWGRAADSMSANDAFMMLMQAPWASSFKGGGYPNVQPRSQYVFTEKIMAPLQLKSGGEVVIVLPPRVRNQAGQVLQPIFEFRSAAGDPSTFGPPVKSVLTAHPRELTPIISDNLAPAWKRTLALSLLSETSFPAALPELLTKAGDEGAPKSLRFAAMFNLSANAHKPAIPLLTKLHHETQDLLLKAAIVEALGDIGEPSAAAVFRADINSADATLRGVAVDSAGKLKDTEAVPLIVALLASSRNESELVDAIVSLGRIASPDAWTAILGAAKNQQTAFQARRTAMQVMGENQYSAGEAVLIGILQNETDRAINLNAISALGKYSTPAAAEALNTAAIKAKDTLVANSAAKALLESRLPDARTKAIAISLNPRLEAADSLVSEFGEKKILEAVPALKTILSDPGRKPATRREAFIAIKAITDKSSAEEISVLWTLFNSSSGDAWEAERVANLLVESGFSDRAVIPALIAGLDEAKNKSWFANVILLRQLTKQDFGPKSSYEGTKETRKSEFDKWRVWAASNPQ